MKKSVFSAAALSALSFLIVGGASAQDDVKEAAKAKASAKAEASTRTETTTKTKLADYEEIIIRKKGDGDSKVTVEIKDGDVTVNGKPIEDFDNETVSVRRRKPAVISYGTARSPFSREEVVVNGFPSAGSPNRAFLGISSNDAADGVKIVEVTKESAAEKAGLKSGDIVLMIDDKKIFEPSDITNEIRKHKPEDKITVTYKRDGKESKVTATLTKPVGMTYRSLDNVQGFSAPNFNFDGLRNLENFKFEGGNGNIYLAGRPRIGIRAQDTEESNGAKVLDVSEESVAAKAGIQKDDLITSFDGKKITNADELSAAAREAASKSSFEVKLTRAGKAQTVEVKIPKKLKTTSL